MLFLQAHEKFLNYLEVIKDKSPKTIEQYNRHINKFNEFLEDKDIDSYKFKVENITLELTDDFREYLYKVATKRISIKTANAYMISIRAFLKYLEKK
jgi:site-specific recombinase XerD